MKTATSIIIASAALALTSTACGSHGHDSAGDLTQWVDPMIGTGDHGHVFLGANVPFGMVQLGPSQPVKGWDWCSGYHHSDSVILGFSHTHLSGTGIGDLGDITFMPAVSRADTALQRFSHADEVCRPGYYKVTLDPSRITAELTATARTGFHRYTYPAGTDTAFVRINLAYGIGWDKPVQTVIHIENDSTVSGYRFSTGWAKDQHVWFRTVFSRPIANAVTDSANALLAFVPDGDTPLMARTGISATSAQGAAANLAAESPGWDFDAVRTRADSLWNSQLAKITVETSDSTLKRKFYTSLYHSMFFPAVFSDTDGGYRAADGTTASTQGRFTAHTILSLWDTYRAAHPLATLIHPERQADYAATFTDIFRHQGKLPVWHLHGNETDCMIGNPGAIVLSDLLLKGFVADTAAAWQAIRTSLMLDERSLAELKRYGYVPCDAPGCEESVAKGLEYAVADDAAARVARRLGLDDEAEYFHRRGQAYHHYFDTITRFMRGRTMAGTFRPGEFNPFVTAHRADDYCEGNAWQYLWMVPHDPRGLISLLGSDEEFIEKFDRFFTTEGSLGADASPDISGMIGQYAHGNEPSHHALYLYAYAGQPWKAAPLLRQVMDQLYHDAPAGLCGNEDAGQMSAWFVLSSMGIYQVEPAGGPFIIGTPMFDKVTINTGNGRRFEITARNLSPENIYIQSARLNGKPHLKACLDFAEIAAGGTLELIMGPEPSPTFATSHEHRP